METLSAQSGRSSSLWPTYREGQDALLLKRNAGSCTTLMSKAKRLD